MLLLSFREKATVAAILTDQMELRIYIAFKPTFVAGKLSTAGGGRTVSVKQMDQTYPAIDYSLL